MIRLACILWLTCTLGGCATNPTTEYRDSVRAVILQHLKEIRACYNEQLKMEPKLAGKLTLRWSIPQSGQATNIAVIDEKTTIKSEPLQSCIIARLETWTFPPDENGKIIDVHAYPFSFSP